MKKFLSVIISLFLVLLCACSNTDKDSKTVKVGASITPHAEILEVAKDIMEEKGYKLQIVTYEDYVLPNTATESGELDANYFQHKSYLDDFNKENGTDLVSVAAIHYEPFGIYAGKTNSLANIKDGTKIAVPNDGTNEARALMLLEDLGLIKLKENVGFTATKLDIEHNYKNIKIEEISAAQLVRALADVDFAIINGNYAIQGGLKVNQALAIENASSEAAQTYANILAVKKGNEDKEGIRALVEALQSEKVKTHIANTYGGAVVAIF